MKKINNNGPKKFEMKNIGNKLADENEENTKKDMSKELENLNKISASKGPQPVITIKQKDIDLLKDELDKKKYFKYLFFNLGGEIFLNSKGDNILSQIDLQSSNRDSIDNFISSEITSNYIIKDENLKQTKTITGVFFNSEDIFISKYFNDKTYLAEEEYINIIII